MRLLLDLSIILELKLWHEDRAFLQSVGFNMRQSNYEKAFALLDDHYGMVKNIFLKQKLF